MTDTLPPLEPGTFTIFTDGAVSGNGTADSTGGWGAIVQDADGNPLRAVSGGVAAGSNNPPTNIRMEQTAVAEALEFLPEGSTVTLYSDLEMISKVMTGQWRGKANPDLWERIRQAAARHQAVEYKWIKGHVSKKDAGDCLLLAGNRAVDALAVAAKHELRAHMVENITAGLPTETASTKVAPAAPRPPKDADKPPIILDYTNWRGVRSERKVIPVCWSFGTNEWHKTPDWLLKAWDLEKQDYRTFALPGLHGMQPTC